MSGLTTEAKNDLANDYAGLATHVGLLSAGTLQADAAAGQNQISLDLDVGNGDTIIFYDGATVQETHTVNGAPTGAGPFIVTLDANLANAYSTDAMVAIIPASSASVGKHELTGGTYARLALGWDTAGTSGGVVNMTGTPTLAVPGGSKVGAIASFTALAAGVMVSAVPVPPEAYTSDGTFVVSSGSFTES